MVRAARDGDTAAGQQAWAIGENLLQSGAPALSALGRAVQALLAGESPANACAALSADLRDAVVAALM